MTNLFISVIVAVYNREKYLRESLTSVLSQTYADYEIVIVDDGSTDRSLSIIDKLSDDKCRIFRKEHTGCWDTKNYAIKQSKGEYLLFVDSDDYISVDYLEKANFLINNNPNYDYYYPSRLEIVDENGISLNKIWRYIDYSGNNLRNLIKLFVETTIGGIPHAGAIIKKEVFERLGYYNSENYNFSDTDYIIRNVFKINFKIVEKLLFYYNRNHSEKLCTNMFHRTKVIAELLDFIFENHNPSFYYKESFKASEAELKGFYNYCTRIFMKYADAFPEFRDNYLIYAEKYLRKAREI